MSPGRAKERERVSQPKSVNRGPGVRRPSARPVGKRQARCFCVQRAYRGVAEGILATPAGFEPATYRLGICRSIRLSYGATLAR